MDKSRKTRLVDRFGREVKYLRLSVTDRCDFRCVYCMDEEMTFVPREQVLSLEELELVALAFVELGVSKVRLTGGEPLIRSGVVSLCEKLGAIEELDELVITTNGSQLRKLAPQLKASGIKRINISLDSLNADRFKELTRTGDLSRVLDGIEAAREQNFERIKLNAVILKGRNLDEVLPLVDFALSKGLDLSFIEEMPLGAISEHSRKEEFVSSEALRALISEKYDLLEQPSRDDAAGPSKYYAVSGSNVKIGFISPHSNNFCSSCNRVRVTAEGRLLLCLGNEHSADLRETIRATGGNIEELKSHIVKAMDLKPEKHFFDLDEEPQIVRFMNTTGG